MNLQLSIGLPLNPRNAPVLEGKVQADGIDLVATQILPAELFWRQLRFADFDISEMSFSSLLITLARGDDRWIGLPVFSSRRFFHTEMMARRDAGIEVPADLVGKRVGVPEYQQTASLWARGALQHEFGVDVTGLEYWMERVPDHSHGGATGFTPPPGVTIHQVPAEKRLDSMILSGELEALLHYNPKPDLVNRSTINLRGHPDIKMLFSDPRAEGIRYYGKTGIYPINHAMVIRREIAEKHPWIVLNIFKMFERAIAIGEAQRMDHVENHLNAGLISPEVVENLRKPLFQHGIKANRTVLEAAAQYSHEQGLTPRLMKLDEVFAASTLDQ